MKDESEFERSAVGALWNIAINPPVDLNGKVDTAAQIKALTFILSRKHNKRWGSRVETLMLDEEDAVWEGEKSKRSAVEEMALRLASMFDRTPPAPHEEPS